MCRLMERKPFYLRILTTAVVPAMMSIQITVRWW
jgi:hypothetical protein